MQGQQSIVPEPVQPLAEKHTSNVSAGIAIFISWLGKHVSKREKPYSVPKRAMRRIERRYVVPVRNAVLSSMFGLPKWQTVKGGSVRGPALAVIT